MVRASSSADYRHCDGKRYTRRDVPIDHTDNRTEQHMKLALLIGEFNALGRDHAVPLEKEACFREVQRQRDGWQRTIMFCAEVMGVDVEAKPVTLANGRPV